MRSSRRHVGLAALALVLAVGGAGLAHAAGRPDRAQLRAELAARRAAGLDRLHAYAASGRFPHDYDVAPALHMFRDGAGRLCAVANLVHLDGQDALVDAVAATHNDLAVADVQDGPLHDWMLGSGFTQEELARVQKPAPRVQRAPAPELLVAGGPVTEAQMNAAMVAHLRAVEAELRAASARSLDVAVDRYLAAR